MPPETVWEHIKKTQAARASVRGKGVVAAQFHRYFWKSQLIALSPNTAAGLLPPWASAWGGFFASEGAHFAPFVAFLMRSETFSQALS